MGDRELDGARRTGTVVGVEQRRDKAIDILNEAFARDYISLEEFEHRVVRAHAATTVEQLAVIVSDLPAEVEHQAEESRDVYFERPTRNFFSIMGDKSLRGPSLENQVTNVTGIMSSTRLDYSEVPLPKGITRVNLTCVMGDVTIIVPEGVTVHTEVLPVMGDCHESRDLYKSGQKSGAILRVTGLVVMGSVSIKPNKPRTGVKAALKGMLNEFIGGMRHGRHRNRMRGDDDD